jgi:hypothetical protein
MLTGGFPLTRSACKSRNKPAQIRTDPDKLMTRRANRLRFPVESLLATPTPEETPLAARTCNPAQKDCASLGSLVAFYGPQRYAFRVAVVY